jgi:hypothetical protein
MPEDIHEDQPADFTSDLKSLRPDLRQRHLYCVKCRKQPYMLETTAMHKGGADGKPIAGEGIVLARVTCHGEREELAIGFIELAHLIESGEKIPVFDTVNRYEVKRIIGSGGFLDGQ